MARTVARTNEKALDAYMTTVAEIDSALTTIKDKVSDQFGVLPGEINWGHVGSAQHVLELLQEIVEFQG